MVLFFAGTSDNPGQVGRKAGSNQTTELSSSQQFALTSIHCNPFLLESFLPELCARKCMGGKWNFSTLEVNVGPGLDSWYPYQRARLVVFFSINERMRQN